MTGRTTFGARGPLRRKLAAQLGRLLDHEVPDAVQLRGGPMDEWIVKPDAAALQPDWWRSWIPSVAEAWSPGRYVLTGKRIGKIRIARWQRYSVVP